MPCFEFPQAIQQSKSRSVAHKTVTEIWQDKGEEMSASLPPSKLRAVRTVGRARVRLTARHEERREIPSIGGTPSPAVTQPEQKRADRRRRGARSGGTRAEGYAGSDPTYGRRGRAGPLPKKSNSRPGKLQQFCSAARGNVGSFLKGNFQISKGPYF